MTATSLYTPRRWLSVSDLTAFARCPRHFFYRTGCRLGGSALAMTFGEAIHAAMNHESLEDRLKAFSAVWGETEAGRFSAGTGYRILTDYHNNWHPPYQPVRLDPSSRSLFPSVSPNEVVFALDIGGHVPLVGRIDNFARYEDKLWILEYKTTGQLTDKFFEAFEPCPQLCCYVLAARTYLNQEIPGAILEAIRVSTANSLVDWRPIRYPDHWIDSFTRWARARMAEIQYWESRLAEGDPDAFPLDFTGCHPYARFGSSIGWRCEYISLCERSDPSTLLEIFTQRPERAYDALSEVTPCPQPKSCQSSKPSETLFDTRLSNSCSDERTALQPNSNDSSLSAVSS